jgi:pimeloyl-ACP methyl ester carboxylesterase
MTMRILTLALILLSAICKITAQDFSVGSTIVTFTDPERNNRQISTAIYYPAETSGQNVPVAEGAFPVISFGHGFVMVHTAYQFLWLDLVPKGYILAFPTTEGSLSPSHLDFGLDLAFIISKMKAENLDQTSMFYEAVAETSGIMGHSMGGGASFLACKDNEEPTTMVTFAAANTNPSSIQAAANVNIPTLLFAGEFDCVTPPVQHQYPMYEATASQQKIIIDIYGGGHCYFADYNFLCSLGEASCIPQPAITRQQQQSATLDFLNPYFDFMLKGNAGSWEIFMDSLQTSQRIDYLMEWSTVSAKFQKAELSFPVFPNPFRNSISIGIPSNQQFDSVIVWNSMGQLVHEELLQNRSEIEINTRSWQRGAYIIALKSGDRVARKKIFKR